MAKNEITEGKGLVTEHESAPETVAVAPVQIPYVPQAPKRMLERQGSRSEPYVRHLPEVRGGVCEFCGILDRNVPSQYQYKLCPHFRDLGTLSCTYCPSTKDPDEVNYKAVLHTMEHPDRPGVYIAVCNSYECEKAHQERWQRAR